MLPRKVDTRAWEVTQPLSKRDQVRAELVARIPRWYNPWAHLAFPSLIGLTAVATAIYLLESPSWRELLFVPCVLILINFNEWHIHRHILHRKTWPLEVLFWRHTPEHHVVFIRDDMAMRSAQEFRLVLIPFYGILGIFLTTLPITATLWWLDHNLGYLWVASSMGYTVAYEWLHLAYHFPADTLIGRSRLIGWLRRFHAMHHTPELMQKWNFNVTIPFADWWLGTIHRDAPPKIVT